MAKKVFVNLPVSDVAKSTAFYEAIGFVKDERFSGEHGASMRWTDDVVFGLMAKDAFSGISSKQVADTRTSATAVFALSFDTREEVDAIVANAVAAGGTEGHEPEDMGFMYSRAFTDPDGHGFGPFFMDIAAFEAMQQAEPEAA